jgi:hypothetical protein
MREIGINSQKRPIPLYTLLSVVLLMNKRIFMALFVGVIAATMIVSTAVTSDVFADRGEAAEHVPEQAQDHMSAQGAANSGSDGCEPWLPGGSC